MKLRTIVIWLPWMFIILGVVGAVGFYRWWNPKPTVSTAYWRQYNELRQPEDWDPDDNGRDLLIGACTAASHHPTFIRPWLAPADMNDDYRNQTRTWIADNRAVLELLEKAMAMKYIVLRGDWPYDAKGYWLISEPQRMHRLRDLLISRGRMKAFDGDARGGLADVLAAARMGEALGEKLTWSEWHSGISGLSYSCIAIGDIVKSSSLNDAALASLVAEIERMSAKWEDITWPVAFERLTFLESVQSAFTDDGHGDGRIIPRVAYGEWSEACYCAPWILDLFYVIANTASHPGRKATIECYDKVAAVYKEAWGRIDPNRKPDKWYIVPPKPWTSLAEGYRFVSKNMPGDYHNEQALKVKRLEAPRTIVTIAVARYKAAKGHLPDTLADVVTAGYLKEMPRAWYNNEEFVYENKGDSFVIYTSATEKKHVEERDRTDAEWKRQLADPNE